jgi:hypothetical protein
MLRLTLGGELDGRSVGAVRKDRSAGRRLVVHLTCGAAGASAPACPSASHMLPFFEIGSNHARRRMVEGP